MGTNEPSEVHGVREADGLLLRARGLQQVALVVQLVANLVDDVEVLKKTEIFDKQGVGRQINL